ncbi:MAG TPA: site-2 protease family protein [Thermomicrobiales bacterium]|nr:site-2 protease family protein [Thermomicrobiales bacterium]
MIQAFRVGRVLGVDVNIHPTFALILLFAFFQWGIGEDGGVLPFFLGCLLVILVFLSVLAHELGHCLMARQFGIEVLDITLWPFSGVARIEQMPASPRHEFLIALAGPGVNLGIFMLLLPPVLLVGVLAGGDTFFSPGGLIGALEPASMLAAVAILNLGLMVFNLLPAFPLDGGRMLRASITSAFGRTRATSIATRLGIGIAIVMIVIGTWQRDILFPMLGVFIIFAAQAETRMVRVEDQMRRLKVGQFSLWDMGGISPSDPLTFALRGGPRDLVVTDNGRVVGMLWRSQLLDGLQGGVAGRTVADVMDRAIYVADVEDSVFDVQQHMNRTQRWAIPVTEEGAYRGIFTAERFVSLYRQIAPGLRERHWSLSDEWKEAISVNLRRRRNG